MKNSGLHTQNIHRYRSTTVFGVLSFVFEGFSCLCPVEGAKRKTVIFEGSNKTNTLLQTGAVL